MNQSLRKTVGQLAPLSLGKSMKVTPTSPVKNGGQGQGHADILIHGLHDDIRKFQEDKWAQRR